MKENVHRGAHALIGIMFAPSCIVYCVTSSLPHAKR